MWALCTRVGEGVALGLLPPNNISRNCQVLLTMSTSCLKGLQLRTESCKLDI
jgi:hypothetical protein